MKINLLIAFCLLLNITVAGAKTVSYADKISVAISESDKSYQLTADYNEADDKKVRDYMDDQLGHASGFSFKNTELDATISLDSKITFYIKTGPGKLVLKFDKRKNSTELYARFKKMCEGISKIVQHK